MAWLSARAFGDVDCAVENCEAQVFGMLLDTNGEALSAPVQLSNDPNPVSSLNFSWDGGGWTAVYALDRLNGRRQVFYGRMTCE